MTLKQDIGLFEIWQRLEKAKETAAQTRVLLNSLLRAQRTKSC